MRKISFVIILTLSFMLSATARADWTVDVESGYVFTGYNDLRIPGTTGTKFSLTDDLSSDATPYLRARLSYSWSDRHTLSILYAPLRVDAAGVFDRPVMFEDILFPAGNNVNARYVFNSYRLTYRYDVYRSGETTIGIGLTGKIRDAEVRLESPDRSASKTNVGFVPLINFAVTVPLSGFSRIIFAGDALAAPQGRAEDVTLAMEFDAARNVAVRAGYRLLEGGADNDEVYSFAMFHYLAAGITLRF